jgi:hypothetical protein
LEVAKAMTSCQVKPAIADSPESHPSMRGACLA